MLAVLLLGLGSWSCSSGDGGETNPITVAVPSLEQNALLYVAESRGLFSRHNLDIIIKDFDTGVAAINAMLNGEADIAGAAEFPFVRSAFEKAPVQVIAHSDKFQNDYILARKDKGIERVSDLKGKRIGVTLKTINEFYLGRFLSLHGLTMQDVTPVDVRPAQFVSAITAGHVDAIIAWQPYVDQIQKAMAEVIAWPAQGSQPVFGVLVATDAWLAQHSEEVERFLRSLKEAEDYLVRHPDEAMAIVQRRLNYDVEYLARVWPLHQFSLSLDLSLITAMNDEARWMIGNNLTTEKAAPDFYDFIYVDGLKAVKPEAVNIVR